MYNKNRFAVLETNEIEYESSDESYENGRIDDKYCDNKLRHMFSESVPEDQHNKHRQKFNTNQIPKPLDTGSNLKSDLTENAYDKGYLSVDALNLEIKRKKLDSRCISFFHLNIRSLVKHEEDLYNLTESINHKFAFIGSK